MDHGQANKGADWRYLGQLLRDRMLPGVYLGEYSVNTLLFSQPGSQLPSAGARHVDPEGLSGTIHTLTLRPQVFINLPCSQ